MLNNGIPLLIKENHWNIVKNAQLKLTSEISFEKIRILTFSVQG